MLDYIRIYVKKKRKETLAEMAVSCFPFLVAHEPGSDRQETTIPSEDRDTRPSQRALAKAMKAARVQESMTNDKGIVLNNIRSESRSRPPLFSLRMPAPRRFCEAHFRKLK